MNKPTVFVIDDDEAVRQSTCALLESNGLNTQPFESAEAFLASSKNSQTGCILLDYRMPGLDGLSALPLLRQACPVLSVIMVTAHGDVSVAVKAMKSGAIDFLEKPWEMGSLLGVIRRALDASQHRAAIMAERNEARARIERLTPRELDVFNELITGSPNKIIAYRLSLSPRTVEFHRARVLEKTGAHSVAELVTLKNQAEAS